MMVAQGCYTVLEKGKPKAAKGSPTMQLELPKVLPPTFHFQLAPRESAPKVEENLGLAYSAALSFVRDGRDVKDTEEYSDALLGLWNAVQNFEQARNSFSTFALRCCRNSILDGIRRRRRREELKENLDDVIGRSHRMVPMDLLESVLVDHPDDSEKDRRCKLVLRRHFIDRIPWEDVGKEFGVSRTYVHRMAKTAIALIRKQYRDLVQVD